ncbi:MAG: succinyl-diaminopimelate desuccinylase [Myxococcota bacterium]|nr:succinyl-diaminopimelate desuccinylase [Myxococcota bacterium]
MSPPEPTGRPRPDHLGDERDEELEELLLALLAIPSPTGEERALADHCAGLLGACAGLTVTRLGNGLVALPPPDGRPTLALVGHLDTVPRAGAALPARRGGEIWGRGASDMKSGLACLLLLARRLPPAAGPFRRVHVLYDREEGPYADNGLEPLLQAVPDLQTLDCALVLEPTNGALQLGALGSLHVGLRVRGTAAHSARPWLGTSAITRALPLLADLGQLPPRRVEVEGLGYHETTTVTLLQAGQTRNVVPDLLEANVNVRFAPGRTPEEAFAELEARVAGRAELTLRDRSPAASPASHHPLLEGLRRCGGLTVEPKQAWTDVARFAARGIAAANFGPGDPELAHRDDERIACDRLADHARILLEFCRG